MKSKKEPVLDPGCLEDLRLVDADGSAHLLDQLIDLFLTSTDAELQELQNCVQRGDASGARFLAHRIKSSSGNLGALQFSTLCETLEVLCKTADPSWQSEATPICLQLLTLLPALKEALQKERLSSLR